MGGRLGPRCAARTFLLALGGVALSASGCANVVSESAAAATDAPSITRATTTTTTSASTSTSTSTTTSTTTTTTTTTVPATTTTLAWQQYPKTEVHPVLPAHGAAPVISHINTTDPVLFLTIDDGIVRDPRVPAFLAEHHIPATLFIVPGAANEDPGYFEQILAIGGSANSHTRHHRDLKGTAIGEQTSEICGGAAAMKETFGSAGHLFRPPYGSWDGATMRAAAQCGMTAVVVWRASMWDGHIDIQGGGTLRAGDIVIAHFRTDLYDNLVLLVELAREQGLTLARLEDYLPAAPG